MEERRREGGVGGGVWGGGVGGEWGGRMQQRYVVTHCLKCNTPQT